MTILSDQQATLSQEPTTLFTVRVARCRLTVTGISGEFATIPLRTRTRGFTTSDFFEGTEVAFKPIQTIPSAAIFAKAPEGVGALDIVYEVRTGADAKHP
jgi:hypothetical protein